MVGGGVHSGGDAGKVGELITIPVGEISGPGG
jgi:hypothetical protein